MKILRTVLLFTTLFSLTACYHPDITQGSNYSDDTLQSLKVGMSKTAVVTLLGTPTLQGPFNPNQIAYLYYDYPNRGKTTQKHVTLTFKNDVLVDIHNEPTQTQN